MIKEVMSLSERINDTSAAPWVIEEIRKLEQQRDALAAHVERLRFALAYSNDYLHENPLNSIGHGSKAHWEMQAGK